LLEGLQWYTSGLSDPRSSLHQEADRDFANARRKAFLRRVVAFLRREPRSDELLSFERVRRELGTAGQAYLGMQSVPISKIVGSVGRHGDFDGAFLPSKGHLRERWQRINRMWRQGAGLPPVRLYKIGDAYFVSDGHHRVSVASYHGIGWIDARVTEFYGPSAPKSIPTAFSDVEMHGSAYPLPHRVAVEAGRTLRLAFAYLRHSRSEGGLVLDACIPKHPAY
jgi:hypothetical protein